MISRECLSNASLKELTAWMRGTFCAFFCHDFLIPACFTFGQRPTMGTVSYSTPSSWDLKQSTQLYQDLLMDSPLFWILNRWPKYFQFLIQTLYLYSTPLNHRWKIICRMVWLKLRGQGFPKNVTFPKNSQNDRSFNANSASGGRAGTWRGDKPGDEYRVPLDQLQETKAPVWDVHLFLEWNGAWGHGDLGARGTALHPRG